MSKTQVAGRTALACTIGLLLLIPAWILWLSPPLNWKPGFLLVIGLTPLLLPLPGLIRGRPYAYAWVAFIALVYFTHGVVEAWANADARAVALAETVLATLLFVAALLYARWRGRELKATRASG